MQKSRGGVEEESEEDRELQDELRTLVGTIIENDATLIPQALDMLSFSIRTSTTSMTSVPKPLKYLAPYYMQLKEAYNNIKDVAVKTQYADVISVLAMGSTGGDRAKEKRDCLKYCLLGTMKNIGDWGHEYIRHLEMEIVDQWSSCSRSTDILIPLVKDIVTFDCKFHAEIQACDLLMEIDNLNLLPQHIDKSTYQRICLYLISCARFVEYMEADKILRLVTEQYIRFNESPRAMLVAMQLNDKEMVNRIFNKCKDVLMLKQMAFMAARQLYPIDVNEDVPERAEVLCILSNSSLNFYFHTLARELDIMEPKVPDEVYKSWLEPIPMRPTVLGENVDSARQNLASSFVNAFVNVGFGSDKLLTPDDGNKWIYRNKDHGMLSATASLGLLHLWDVDGGLTPIDKYLYTSDEQVKAGALLAMGIVNCRVRNECDPALALLADFVAAPGILRVGAIFGLGLAYAGTNRDDVLKLLVPAVENSPGAEILSTASLACGLVAVGTCNASVSNAILTKLVDARDSEILKSPYMRLVLLGLGLCYLGRRCAIETSYEALEVFSEPFKTISQTTLQMCGYAGTGDVLVIQELLRIVSERIVIPEEKPKQPETTPPNANKDKEKKKKRDWDPNAAQAVASLAAAVVALGEDTGAEMCQRILGNMGRYGELGVRRAVPLAVALLSVSCPQLSIIDFLTKYAHDPDEEVSCNAIFCLGIIGAGTNNARLAGGLRQLSVYHSRNSAQLFMVRLAQGLTHLGKGTLTLSPLHTDRQLVDPCAMAGLLIPLVALLDTHALILGKAHYLLFALAAAMQPRWLLALDEELQPIALPIRVGQAVDTVGKAGTPKTIAGIHTHSTPVLLGVGERAELATDQYEQLGPTLDGICILKKKKE